MGKPLAQGPPKPRAHGPWTLPAQAKPLWAFIGNWHRYSDRARHRDRHRQAIRTISELVPKGK